MDGGFEVWLLNRFSPNLCFPNAFEPSARIPLQNLATHYLTFATEIRHHFALGDMDYDNHSGRGKQVYVYIMHNASTQGEKVNAYIPRAWPKI